MDSWRFVFLFLLWESSLLGVMGYPGGNVESSCSNLMPSHGANAQTSNAPYTVVANPTTFKAGDTITVTLRATSGSFKGFLLEAWEVGGSTPVGSFTSLASVSQGLTCSGIANSAVSHTSSSSKTSIQATWKAPSSGSLKDIQFSATFVQSTKTFWVAVKSGTVTYSGTSVPNPVTTAHTSTTTQKANSPVSVATVTGTVVSDTVVVILNKLQISNDACGINKTCFSSPSGCNPQITNGCYFMSAVALSSSIQFEISAPSNGYIAIGFSDDTQMGSDDVYICGKDANGNIQVQHAFSTGTTTPTTLPLGNVTVITSSISNGIISCSFISRNSISTQSRAVPSLLYYIMLGSGPSANGQIQMHTQTPFVSAQKIDLSAIQAVGGNAGVSDMIKAHGALMLIAWMTTGSIGMIMARYFKKIAHGQAVCGKDIWFLAHVFLMVLTVVATGIAFIIIFVEAMDWSGGAHPVLGCIVMILALVQPFGALFRCGPTHKLRIVFNVAHALNAFIIKIIAVAAIFTGLQRIDSSSNQWLAKVMGGFVGWEFLFYLLQDFNLFLKRKGRTETVMGTVNLEIIFLTLYFIGNLTFLIALLVGIGMS
ncbi:putative ferric-chelate reductase 1 isoform X2 [Amia ocellicauda]|uniref:putative ferric-chelate reductase 1 isoform X2 n=1 Tax=Amia ocellicauda TaxID=2972642 RepID=UPI003464339C